MANPEHLKILKQGKEIWNSWRQNAKHETPALNGANFKGLDLSEFYLRGADFGMSDLSFANLIRADLTEASFTNGKLVHADLTRVEAVDAYFGIADLSGACLRSADLTRASFRNANLYATNFRGATLQQADFENALVRSTIFVSVDLSTVKGLEHLVQRGPCGIGIDTLYESRGLISDIFLRQAGVPEEMIDIARAVRNGPPIQWHSCFISYSTKDEEFARRLHSRMREANMRVWFAPEDLQGGKKLHEQLFEAIQIHDRLLIVLSEHSIQSEWVMTEIRKAREVEKKEKRRKLFPIRLTDFETLRDWTCFDADIGKDLTVVVREYFIHDFSNRKNHDTFESAFARLKNDLEAENSTSL